MTDQTHSTESQHAEVSADAISGMMRELRSLRVDPRIILCGERAFLALEAGLSRNATAYGGALSVGVKQGHGLGERASTVTTLSGMRVVMSRKLHPDFLEVLPDPAIGVRLPSADDRSDLAGLAARESLRAPASMDRADCAVVALPVEPAEPVELTSIVEQPVQSVVRMFREFLDLAESGEIRGAAVAVVVRGRGTASTHDSSEVATADLVCSIERVKLRLLGSTIDSLVEELLE